MKEKTCSSIFERFWVVLLRCFCFLDLLGFPKGLIGVCRGLKLYLATSSYHQHHNIFWLLPTSKDPSFRSCLDLFMSLRKDLEAQMCQIDNTTTQGFKYLISISEWHCGIVLFIFYTTIWTGSEYHYDKENNLLCPASTSICLRHLPEVEQITHHP